MMWLICVHRMHGENWCQGLPAAAAVRMLQRQMKAERAVHAHQVSKLKEMVRDSRGQRDMLTWVPVIDEVLGHVFRDGKDSK